MTKVGKSDWEATFPGTHGNDRVRQETLLASELNAIRSGLTEKNVISRPTISTTTISATGHLAAATNDKVLRQDA